MAQDKASFFTRPDGRVRAAVIVPILLFALLVGAVIWQSQGMP